MSEHINPESQEKDDPIINHASLEDLSSIEEILRATIQDPYGSGNIDEEEVAGDLKKIKTELEGYDEAKVLVAKIDGKTLGFAFYQDADERLLKHTRSDADLTQELYLLYLNPQFRKQGVGTKLLRAVESEVQELGKTNLVLASGPRYLMLGVSNFYSQNGYESKGMIPGYFGGKYFARVFQKDLTDVINPTPSV